MERKTTLLHLLEENRKRFHVEFRGFLSNHWSMASIALYDMGASSQRLNNYFDFYSQRLEKAILVGDLQITQQNWKEFLGKKKFYPELRIFFQHELQRLGSWQNLVDLYLPTLLEGMVGAAFHGILHLGYGIHLEDPATILDGLAYWTFAWKSLGTVSQFGKGTMTPLDVLKYYEKKQIPIKSQAQFQVKIDKLTSENMELLDIANELDLQSRDPQKVLQGIASTIIGLYSTSHDFFVLHGVTGSQAFRWIFSYIKDDLKPISLIYLMRAILATYIVQGRPTLEFANPEKWKIQLDELSWPRVCEIATADQDEHVIKLVYTCWSENQNNPNPLYLLCASQMVSLIPKDK